MAQPTVDALPGAPVESLEAAPRRHVAAFDVMRAVAAAAVVLVHVLGPYREKLGEIPDAHFAFAVALNGALRWSVPLFIIITGALLLSDPRPFSLPHYVRRRVVKVVVPFLFFSCCYAVLGGVSPSGFDPGITREALRALPEHETYYHLGFYYYFIPLYLVAPLLAWLVRGGQVRATLALLAVWLLLTGLRLAGVNGPWNVDPVMFGGWLLLGYALFRHGTPPLALLLPLGVAALALTDWIVITQSLGAGEYRSGNWFSYKTLNTVALATLVFAACLHVAERSTERAARVFAFIGRHSLGIYLLHPLFLWPARAFDLYAGHPLLPILFWTALSGSLALGASVLLSRHRATRWMVP